MGDHDDGHGEQTAAFPCSLCDKPAATIALAPDGLIVIAGLIGRTTMRIQAEDVPKVRDILARRDACALYALNDEWASFYCPACDRSYCADHWHFAVRYDDDFPGWYDSTTGTCPAGHTRLVDD
jgi:hypothetical protein